MNTILITGATGFIGGGYLRFLRDEGLDRDHQFVLLAREDVDGWITVRDGRNTGSAYRFTAASLADVGVDRVDAVVHLGGFIPKSGGSADDTEGAQSNIRNTRYLVENLPNRPKRFVFASTVDVFGPAANGADETRPCTPQTLYAHSKLFAERMLESLMPPNSGTELQILRLGHTYGPGEEVFRKFIPESIRRILAGEGPFLATDGSERRSYIHVRDCCRLIHAALLTSPNAGPIILASAHSVTINQAAEELCKIAERQLGKKAKIDFARELRQGHDVTFNVTKMERLLGREEIRFSDGLTEEFEAMRAAQP